VLPVHHLQRAPIVDRRNQRAQQFMRHRDLAAGLVNRGNERQRSDVTRQQLQRAVAGLHRQIELAVRGQPVAVDRMTIGVHPIERECATRVIIAAFGLTAVREDRGESRGDIRHGRIAHFQVAVQALGMLHVTVHHDQEVALRDLDVEEIGLQLQRLVQGVGCRAASRPGSVVSQRKEIGIAP
jgi:hypothetical protein